MPCVLLGSRPAAPGAIAPAMHPGASMLCNPLPLQPGPAWRPRPHFSMTERTWHTLLISKPCTPGPRGSATAVRKLLSVGTTSAVRTAHVTPAHSTTDRSWQLSALCSAPAAHPHPALCSAPHSLCLGRAPDGAVHLGASASACRPATSILRSYCKCCVPGDRAVRARCFPSRCTGHTRTPEHRHAPSQALRATHDLYAGSAVCRRAALLRLHFHIARRHAACMSWLLCIVKLQTHGRGRSCDSSVLLQHRMTSCALLLNIRAASTLPRCACETKVHAKAYQYLGQDEEHTPPGYKPSASTPPCATSSALAPDHQLALPAAACHTWTASRSAAGRC